MRAAPAGMSVRDMPASPLRQIDGGLLCNAFNPRAPIYSLALFTVVQSPGLPLPTLLTYGAWIVLLRHHGGARCARADNCARLNALARLAASGQTD